MLSFLFRHRQTLLSSPARTEIGMYMRVTCDDDNVASASVIETVGGVLEDVRTTSAGVAKRRYWIG